MNRNNSALNSFEKKKYKKFSYDKSKNIMHLESNNKTVNKYSSTIVFNNDINNCDELLYNIEQKNINPYYCINNQIKNSIKSKRCSSVSNEEPNISKMINNYNYNNTMNIKGNGNFENKINNNKIELDLALKIFSFF